MKTGIIWDLDGTLLNTLDDLTDAVNYSLRQYGCPERTAAEVRSFLGNGAKKLIWQALPSGEDAPDPEEVLKTYQKYYQAHCQIQTAPYPGIPEVLDQLSREGIPMAVVSNKPDGAVKALCAHWFPQLQARGEAPDCPRKPAPDMVLKAMEDLGADQYVYVGDSEVDVLTAQNAGIPCISVTWGFRDEADLIAGGAQHLCHTPDQFPTTLKTLLDP